MGEDMTRALGCLLVETQDANAQIKPTRVLPVVFGARVVRVLLDRSLKGEEKEKSILYGPLLAACERKKLACLHQEFEIKPGQRKEGKEIRAFYKLDSTLSTLNQEVKKISGRFINFWVGPLGIPPPQNFKCPYIGIRVHVIDNNKGTKML
eukprot:1157994-Pelagomonas_calceolata.AAC.2